MEKLSQTIREKEQLDIVMEQQAKIKHLQYQIYCKDSEIKTLNEQN